MSPRDPLVVHLENFTGYATSDLYRFFTRGLKACGVTGHVYARAVVSPIFTRGCADIGGRRMIVAFNDPARFDLRRTARVLVHEAAHLRGMTHERMPEALRYSEGPVPAWARGLRFRHVRRAPDQLAALRRPWGARQHRHNSAVRDVTGYEKRTSR